MSILTATSNESEDEYELVDSYDYGNRIVQRILVCTYLDEDGKECAEYIEAEAIPVTKVKRLKLDRP
jgi:hypothetical protein